MNIAHDFTTEEEGIEELKRMVKVRNQMGGVMYYNMANDDCISIAKELHYMGVDKNTIQSILDGKVE